MRILLTARESWRLAAACVAVFALAATPFAQRSGAQPSDAHRFVAARFDGVAPSDAREPALVVLANHDAVQKNARAGRPMKLAGKEFVHGLYCHAPSKIVVRAPAPATRFTALVGIDSNEQTSGGRGSVEFSVAVGAESKFRSPIVREGAEPLAVDVELGGASEFTLEISDGGDGIACDQSDWADAHVRLADGRDLWLADLPIDENTDVRLFANDPPFSFVFGGKPSSELLASWPATRSTRQLDEHRTEHSLGYVDRASGLEVHATAIEYLDFPTLEWTLEFADTGSRDTPILEQIRALDIAFDRGAAGEFLLHHAVGSPADGNDYAPLETPLPANSNFRMGAAGGRPTNTDWAYFDLECAGRGWIGAIGWPGQWSAEFARDAARGLNLRAGQELTHFVLHPGERVRSPLIALQFWRGDWIDAQNVWRRWMMAHSMPKPGGRLPEPQLLASSARQLGEMIHANEANQIAFLDRYREEKIRLDYWWMDAGWYVNRNGWPDVGTWEVDPARFPRGLRAISDHAHEQGVRTLLWFEPERVAGGTWLAQNHPEWILGGANGGLLNLGNRDAREWLTSHVDRVLTEQGIDLYRQDFNMDPLAFWRANDAPDRQGITEIEHVTGYLAYWDELLRRHPNLLIDSCASGGRRNDLETMRRAVPLWRSDYAYECTGTQCMTYGISLWLPYSGTGTVAARNVGYYGDGATPVEPYAFWSNAAPSLGCAIDIREKSLDYATLRRLIDEWRAIDSNYYGDFHPLTKWTRDDTQWIAWQFDRPESGEGMVQAFRRENSLYESASLKLRRLDASMSYALADVDGHELGVLTGSELAERGLTVKIATEPGVAVITYRRFDTASKAK